MQSKCIYLNELEENKDFINMTMNNKFDSIQKELIVLKKSFDLDDIRIKTIGYSEDFYQPWSCEVKFKHQEDWYSSREISLQEKDLQNRLDSLDQQLRKNFFNQTKN